MPNSSQKFTINSNGASPTGNGAQMSRTGAGNLPNQGYWQTAGTTATVKLPAAVWNVTPDPGQTTFSFSLANNATSATYTLRIDAPLNSQSYEVDTAPGVTGGNSQPSVIVNP